MCLYGVCAPKCLDPWRSEVTDPLELELQNIVSHSTWVLGTELGSSRTAGRTLKVWAVTPVLLSGVLQEVDSELFQVRSNLRDISRVVPHASNPSILEVEAGESPWSKTCLTRYWGQPSFQSETVSKPEITTNPFHNLPGIVVPIYLLTIRGNAGH